MAKMYVALQDPKDPGVLILSQFAGAVSQMEGAIIVNPYDPEAMASAVERALQMPLHVRLRLHARLMKGLHMYNSHHWAESFLRMLNAELAVPEVLASPAFFPRLSSSRAWY